MRELNVPSSGNSICKGPGVGIERPVRLEQNEEWRIVQMLMTNRFSSVVMPTNSQGLLTWGPQTSKDYE